ncbi:DUF881 domain-containing protein [Candidatus Peregrinibacteria bacterium]|nr:DUF881 domain-containing protein [Candidatus Peregrinibacteria bacterium]
MSRKLTIISISAILGVLLIIQAHSLPVSAEISTRDTALNMFREIQILKDTNRNLKSEIEKLTTSLEQLRNRSSALRALETEIAKNKLISGDTKIQGEGIRLTIGGDFDAVWMIDLVNELLLAGAETISINNIRLTNQTIGIDTLPNNQILLNGIILSQPYVFEAIGNSKILTEALEQPGGFTAKLNEFKEKVSLLIEKQKSIEMEKI